MSLNEILIGNLIQDKIRYNISNKDSTEYNSIIKKRIKETFVNNIDLKMNINMDLLKNSFNNLTSSLKDMIKLPELPKSEKKNKRQITKIDRLDNQLTILLDNRDQIKIYKQEVDEIINDSLRKPGLQLSKLNIYYYILDALDKLDRLLIEQIDVIRDMINDPLINVQNTIDNTSRFLTRVFKRNGEKITESDNKLIQANLYTIESANKILSKDDIYPLEVITEENRKHLELIRNLELENNKIRHQDLLDLSGIIQKDIYLKNSLINKIKRQTLLVQAMIDRPEVSIIELEPSVDAKHLKALTREYDRISKEEKRELNLLNNQLNSYKNIMNRYNYEIEKSTNEAKNRISKDQIEIEESTKKDFEKTRSDYLDIVNELNSSIMNYEKSKNILKDRANDYQNRTTEIKNETGKIRQMILDPKILRELINESKKLNQILTIQQKQLEYIKKPNRITMDISTVFPDSYVLDNFFENAKINPRFSDVNFKNEKIGQTIF